MTDDLDLEERRLCPDGACIGVLGADGRCGVCGRAEDGSAAEPVPAAADAEAAGADEGTPDGDDDRQLCPDGACIGVIGDDGRCRECGRAAVGS